MLTSLIYLSLVGGMIALYALGQRFRVHRRVWWFGAGILAVSLAIFMAAISMPHQAFRDFRTAYYSAGSTILRNPPGLYAGEELWFVNIPILAYLFSPFALLDVRMACFLMTVLGVIAVLAAGYGLVKRTGVCGWKRAALVGLFLINGPLYHSLREGNMTHIVLLMLVAAWVCLEQDRQVWLGILLAVAGVIKPPLLLLSAPFVLRRRWRVVGAFGGTLLVVVGTSLLLCGVELHRAWFHACVQPFLHRPLGAFNVQSVDGFLARLLLSTDYLWKWAPIETVTPTFTLARHLLLSVLIGGTLWISWRSKPPATVEAQSLELSIVLCLALLISPISWSHYYLLLLLPLALALGDRLAIPRGWGWSSGIWLGVVLISPPVHRVHIAHPVLRVLVERVLLSHYFFGGLALLVLFLAARLRYGTALGEQPMHAVAIARDSEGQAAVAPLTIG